MLGTPIPGVFATYSSGGREFSRHWHDVYGFGLLDRGAQSWASGRGRVDAYAGHVITTNPGEVHDGRPLGGPSRRWRIVSVDPEVMRSVSAQRRGDAEIVCPVIDDARLVLALQGLFAAIERWEGDASARTALERLAVEERLVESCVLLMQRHGSAPAAPDPARANMHRVRERLADDMLTVPSLADLASIAGLSRFQLLRRFRAQFGVTPHAWVVSRRAERARACIRGGATLAGAALASGFADQSHMTRVFARHYGYTPGAWRRASDRS